MAILTDKVTPDFYAKVQSISSQLGLNPDWLMYVMYSESQLNPQAQNAINATGLIQFLPSTAKGLGTTTADLLAMDGVSQLDYVSKYFQNVIKYYGTINSVNDTYLAIFYPKALTYSDTQKFPDSVYQQNQIFDFNNLGYLTKSDFNDYVNSKYNGDTTAPGASVTDNTVMDNALSTNVVDNTLGVEPTVFLPPVAASTDVANPFKNIYIYGGSAILLLLLVFLFIHFKYSKNGN